MTRFTFFNVHQTSDIFQLKAILYQHRFSQPVLVGEKFHKAKLPMPTPSRESRAQGTYHRLEKCSKYHYVMMASWKVEDK